MFRPRIIPVLLLKDKGLVKTTKFDRSRYIGDPINAVKIFNDLEADELVFLDITATKEGRTISLDLVKDIGDEAYMPFGVGGGIRRVEEIGQLIKAGAEKVVINTAAANNRGLLDEAANLFGSQSIVVSVDVKKSLMGHYQVFVGSGSQRLKVDLTAYVKEVEAAGAGEIMVNSIDRDGMMNGYDIDLIRTVAEAVSIPVIACGGAGRLTDFLKAVEQGKASAVAAGSMFVFHGPRKAVLINYPDQDQLRQLFG